MALTIDILKAFMHPTLLENFPDEVVTVDGTQTPKPNATLTNAITISEQSYNSLTGSLPSRVVVRFDSVSFQVKNALVYVYTYVMQDKALLHNLTLTGMGLSEGEVFAHFLALRNSEQDDIDAMRKELLEEIRDKETDTKNLGVVIHQRYGRRLSGRRLP